MKRMFPVMTDFHPRPIALLTDFGLTDWFVAAMKGEILRRAPAATIIDISHGVPPQQVASAAFTLGCVARSLPDDTVFCCVVDPGVGGDRRAICGRVGRWMFSGPDNGLITPLFHMAGGDVDLHLIASAEFRNETLISATFHGRDLFAPAAACLAMGADPAQAGPQADHPILLGDMQPVDRGACLVARVMLIDHFGNLVTNLTRQEHGPLLDARPFVLRAGRLSVTTLEPTFGAVDVGNAVAYWGSAGTLEIGINQGSAAQRSGLPVGGPVEIVWK
jgi:S-adenosylmethionine hydrolase